MIRSLYFHNPSPEEFEKIIRYLIKRNYTFLSTKELYTRLKEQNLSGKLAFVSFDDGWKGNLELLPILEKYHVPVTIFVAVEPLYSGNYWWEYVLKDRGYERLQEFKKLSYNNFYSELADIKKRVGTLKRSSMTVDELKQLSEHPLVDIQSHTLTHPILTHLPFELLDRELRESKERLENLTGKDIFAFSYPNGYLTVREIDLIKKYYQLAFSTIQNNILPSDNLYLLPRYALTGNYVRDLLKMYGMWKWMRKPIRAYHMLKKIVYR